MGFAITVGIRSPFISIRIGRLFLELYRRGFFAGRRDHFETAWTPEFGWVFDRPADFRTRRERTAA